MGKGGSSSGRSGFASAASSRGGDAARFTRPGAQAARRQAEAAPTEARNRALNDRIRARLRGRNNGG